MAHIDRIKRRARHLGMPKGVPHAWYYRMPWVLVAAALMLIYRHLIESPMERLLFRRR